MSLIEKIGPGLWYEMHYYANLGIDKIDEIIRSLPCDDCYEHATAEVKELRKRYTDPLDISVRLQNSVNRRQGKREYSVQEVRVKFNSYGRRKEVQPRKRNTSCINCPPMSNSSATPGYRNLLKRKSYLN